MCIYIVYVFFFFKYIRTGKYVMARQSMTEKRRVSASFMSELLVSVYNTILLVFDCYYFPLLLTTTTTIVLYFFREHYSCLLLQRALCTRLNIVSYDYDKFLTIRSNILAADIQMLLYQFVYHYRISNYITTHG